MLGESLCIHAPERSRLDEAVEVRVTGAEAGTTVEVEATLVDDDGVEWTARAQFAADGDGTVDLGAAEPAAGDWADADAMGWCWAMTSEAEAATASVGREPTVPVTFAASTADGRTATRTVTRQVFDEGVAVHDLPDAGAPTGVTGSWYEPSGEGPHPAVVSLHGGGGRRGPDRTELRLASHGYATLALEYVGDAAPLPDRLARVRVPEVVGAVEWVRTRDAVADGPVGLFGVSRGAELALEVGARSDAVGAVVSYAGSGVRYDTPAGVPAWVDGDGEPLPHLSGVGEPERTPDGGVVSRPVLERGFEQATGAERDAATIPVEKIDGPVLLVSGGDDTVWPARRLSAVAADRLASADRDAPHRHRSADDVGHLIGVPYVPLADFDRGGGTPAATARLGAEAWTTALEFFERGLPAHGD